MQNTAMKIAALGAALSVLMLTPVVADEARRQETAGAAVATTAQPPAPAESAPITTRDGKVVTLEVLKNDAEWRAATAQMLKRQHVYR